MANKFIVFEGVAGSGKSRGANAFVNFLEEALQKEGKSCDFVFADDPGYTALGITVQEILARPKGRPFHPNTIALLKEAARIELRRSVEYIFEQCPDSWVLCDKGPDYDWAVGNAEGVAPDLLEDLEFHRPDPSPLVTVYFDVSEDVAKLRCAENSKLPNGYLAHVLEGYEERISYVPQLFYVIDADRTIEEVDKQLKELAESLAKFGIPPKQELEGEYW